MQFAIKKFRRIALFITFISVTIALNSCTDNYKESETVMAIEPSAELKINMRKLWTDHIIWTRNVILCIVDDLPGKDEAVKRLLQNQVELGNAFKPYYGEAAGNELTRLLNPHITLAAEVVVAAKNKNNRALNKANSRWYANADDIALFLSQINTNWNESDMKMMFHEHLKMAASEANNRINKDYPADIIEFDKMHTEILVMADMFADGIVTQFPETFTNANNNSTNR